MRTIGRLSIAAIATTLLVLGPLSTAAHAHVTVTSPNPVQGGWSQVGFIVPTEKDVPTTKIEVAFPSDSPLSEVLVRPMVGWASSVTMVEPASPVKNDDGDDVTEVASRVTWTATAGGIPPEQYQEFEIEAGPFPKAPQIEFKVLQTYRDGSVTSWIQEAAAGGGEPEFPAPVLALSAASAFDAAPAAAIATEPASAAQGVTSGRGTVLGSAALLIAVLALLLAGYAVFRAHRVRAPGAS